MDKTREARRSTTTMAASNDGVTKRRQRISENSREQMHQEVRNGPRKKERDLESLKRRSKRRRSERDTEEDESLGDEDVQHNYQRKSFPSGRIPRHASPFKVADEMIGVPVPRKARSACIKRSHDCRTSSGRAPASPRSYSLEVVSPSSSTLSVKQKKKSFVNGSKSRIPKPPKSSGTVDDDLEIEIAEVLSGLKKHPPHCPNNSLKSSEFEEIGGFITCKARFETLRSANIDKSTNSTKSSSAIHEEIEARQETLSILDGVQDKQRLHSAVSNGVSEGPQLGNNRDESNSTSKLEIDLMVPPTMPSSPERASRLPLVLDSLATKDYCKRDTSVKNEITPENIPIKVENREWLNLDMERPNHETGKDSCLSLQNLDWSQPHQAKSAQQRSVLPLPVAVGSWPSGLPPQGYVPLIQIDIPVDESNGSSTFVLGAPFSASEPRPKRCATHFFIARNIQLHQHFVKTNHLSTPNKGSVYLKGGDLRSATGNPSLQGSSPILCLNSQAHDRIPGNISVLKGKTYESGHFASSRQKKSPPPPASSSIVPAPVFIYPTNHHLQSFMGPSKSSLPTKSPRVAVGSASVNFSHPSSSASEASSPYFTVLPNNAYSFQMSSTIRGGTQSQALPFFNGSFYSPQMFQQAPQILERQSQVQKESKVSSCSSSSHRQPLPQVSVNSLSNQANVQQSQKSEAKAAGDDSDSRVSHTQKVGPYGQIMTGPGQPQNFSMSFASFPSRTATTNLNFSSNGYRIVSAAPVVKNHQASESKTGGGSCSSNAEDPKKTLHRKPPAIMNGQTLVFDNPSRTLNFISGTWPPPAATTINGDPSVFTQHLTQRQHQSGRSKMMTHPQADSVSVTSSQWKNPATSSITSTNSVNLKQFQSQQQIRTHRQTQISFAAPLKPQPSPSQGQEGRSGGSSSSVIGSASHGKAANPKVSSSKSLPLSPIPSSSAHAQKQTDNSASGSTQKTSPVCGRTVPPIITSC